MRNGSVMIAQAPPPVQLPAIIPRRRMPPAARQAVPLICALAMTAGLAFNGLNDAAGNMIAAMLGGGLLALLLLDARPGPTFWRQRRVVLLPASLAGLWLSVTAIGVELIPAPLPLPLAPDFAYGALLAWLGGLAALISGSIIGADRIRMHRTIRLIALCLCTTLFIGLAMWFAGDSLDSLDYWTITRRGRFAGLVGNVNVTAALAGGLVILALALATDNVRRGQGGAHLLMALGAIGMAAIGMIAALLTAARFPIVIALFLLIALPFVIARKAKKVRRGVPWLGLFTALLLGVLLWFFSVPLLARFDTLGPEAQVRSMMWDHYLDLALQSPFQGYGPGSFPTLNAANLDNPLIAKSLWFVNSAHNLFLQLALSGGFPYLLLMLSAGLALFRPVVRLLSRGRFSVDAMGIFGLILQLWFCALVDITLDVPAVILLALFLTGLLWGRALKLRERSAASA
jgi:hypothetical protein